MLLHENLDQLRVPQWQELLQLQQPPLKRLSVLTAHLALRP